MLRPTNAILIARHICNIQHNAGTVAMIAGHWRCTNELHIHYPLYRICQCIIHTATDQWRFTNVNAKASFTL